MLTRVALLLTAGLVLAQTAADPAATARKALDLLLGAKYTDLSALFTPEMKKDLGATQLAALGPRVQSFGALQKIDDPSVQKLGPNTVVIFPAHFAAQNINFRYIVNQNGMIGGMFLLPGAAAWSHPSYAKPDSFHERDITIGDDEWKLPGTLTLPNGSGPFPAVVLVHGSGPNDRDETVFGTKVFKDLAEGLASRGIAVLRYEKRTKQYQAKVAGLNNFTIEDEIVDDAARASQLLRTQKEIDPARVYVLGHSLGAYAAPRIWEEDNKIAGLIFLAGNARPIEDMFVEQAAYLGLPAKDQEGIKAAAARIKGLEPADASAPALLGMSATYLLDLKNYDPVAAAKKVTAPMLFLQGERDYQTTMKDFGMFKAGLAARKDVMFRSYPALNHLFVAGEGKSTEAEYRKPGHVAPEAVDDIAKFIAK